MSDEMSDEMGEKESSADSGEWQGACICRAVTFRIERPVATCVHCHCTICQRNHGAGYVTWIALPLDKLTVDRGKEELTKYASSEHGSRSFCRRCGTSLFCQLDDRPDEIDIPLANLEPGSGIKPQAHIFFDDRPDWSDVRDELPRLGGKSGVEPIQS